MTAQRYKRRCTRGALWLVGCLLGGVAQAQALDLSEMKLAGMCKGVVLNGEIAHGEAAAFIERLVAAAERCGTRNIIVGRMPGGSVKDAIEIGTEIRARDYVTVMRLDSICASACGLIYLGGAQRYWHAGATFIIHRPTIKTATPFKSIGDADRVYEELRARLIRYVAGMGGNPDYVDLMYAVTEDRGRGARNLDRVDLMRLGLFTHTGSPF